MSEIVVIAGPTAVGKTAYAIEIAKAFNGEVVSCDSMQLYKYMDIGSAKPDHEELSQVVHHMVDIIDPREDFSVAAYEKLAREAIRDIFSRDKTPVISGGTGLYLNSLLYDMDFTDGDISSDYRQELEGLRDSKGSEYLHELLYEKDPEAAARIHPNNTKKVIRALERIHEGEVSVRPFDSVQMETAEYQAVLIGLTRNREELYARINERVDALISRGLIDEVKGLMEMGLDASDISMKGIGYKEIIEYLTGETDINTAIDNIKKNTRHYAKRQLTWFRRYDKMKWYNLSEYLNDEDAIKDICQWLNKNL
ncbi:MAG: tRNA (adenosine(37)-N6)-dimethylallyltransferase MiaA [Lentihominibacter sp.]